MSLVMRSPAIGITAVWRMAPPVKMAISVVPAPMSTRATPSSRSSSVSTAWLLASGLSKLLHFQAAAAHAFDDVLGRALRTGHDVDLGLQADAAHADGLFHVLPVDR